MSAEDVRRVLRRAQTDDEFYLSLRRDPETALSGYDLTDEERAAVIRRDQTLYRYLVPSLPVVPERAISIVITITGEHDWFNVTRLADADALAPEAVEEAKQLAGRVLGSAGAERVDMLMTMLQLLDGRAR